MIKKISTITIFSGALITLLSLSYWQIERKKWKSDIIQRLDAEYQKDPTQNQFNFADLQSIENGNALLRYGQITGRLIYDKEILVGPKPFDGSVGYQVITPLQLSTGQYVLVNRGWVDNENKGAIHKIRPHTNITISGIFRKPDWNKFTPDNSPKNNVWTKLDITQIAQVKRIKPTAPVMLYANNMSKNFSPIILQNQKWYPRNKHLQYAIFWFTMALVLLIMVGLFIRKNKKI